MLAGRNYQYKNVEKAWYLWQSLSKNGLRAELDLSGNDVMKSLLQMTGRGNAPRGQTRRGSGRDASLKRARKDWLFLLRLNLARNHHLSRRWWPGKWGIVWGTLCQDCTWGSVLRGATEHNFFFELRKICSNLSMLSYKPRCSNLRKKKWAQWESWHIPGPYPGHHRGGVRTAD